MTSITSAWMKACLGSDLAWRSTVLKTLSRALAGHRTYSLANALVPRGPAAKLSDMDPLTGTLVLAVAKAAGTAAGKEAVQFVGPLIGLVNAQQKVLDEIRRDTKALFEAPYLSAKTYLNNAAAAVDPDYQRELLLAAEAKFVDATSHNCAILSRRHTPGRHQH